MSRALPANGTSVSESDGGSVSPNLRAADKLISEISADIFFDASVSIAEIGPSSRSGKGVRSSQKNGVTADIAY
ncbi:hypothetical protein GCM10019059_36190 [Camelimonas fluminis]|nr:hypothetical protein GCM10019059_36190 [Camelimonas fluminis]